MKPMKQDIISGNQQVTTFFALGSIQLRESKKNGQKYLNLGLSDKTGKIRGYLWNDPEDAASELKEGTLVKVRGISNIFNGSLIINVEQIRTAKRSEVDIEDFLEIVPGGVDLWLSKLTELIESVQDTDCRILMDAFLSDDRFMESFKTSPGGLHIHHNYVGGLLEHTTNAMVLVSQFSDLHPGLIDRDILVTGAFLHDIGKTREILWDITKDYTTEGKMLGHIILGVMMLKEKVSTIPKFPADLSTLLLHLIASHHGHLEYGSPVKPATPEAWALHVMEAADAKINHMYRHLNSSDPDKDWSCYDKILETQIYQKKYARNIQRTSLIAV